MFDNIVSAENINYFLVFLEGLLSFFSPCILPLLPVYLGYLAGNTKEKLEDGTYRYKQSTVFLHTLCFVLGISFAFFILGMAFSALGSFFQEYKLWFSRVGGVLIIFLALIQLGFLRFSFLSREKKLPFRWNLERMNPFVALIMGFTFSFAWTPCVGPALSSVLILASSAENALIGNLLVLVYTAGFIIPFLLLGLFTSKALNFVKKNQKIMKYTIKAGGILLLFIGIMTVSYTHLDVYKRQLFRKGADVIYEALMDVHVSGHACQEELKLILGIVKPKYFMPVHGEYRHLMCHAQLAQKIGIPKSNVFISQIGKILEVTKEKVKFNGSVSSGRIFVDGLGVGDVGNIVLRDRKHLSQDGLIVIVVTVSHNITEVVAGPDVISRGFVYVRESEDLMDNVKNIAKETMEKCIAEGIKDWSSLKNEVRSNVFSYLSHATKRHPMILPVIMEV